jgi:hypothetical protein
MSHNDGSTCQLLFHRRWFRTSSSRQADSTFRVVQAGIELASSKISGSLFCFLKKSTGWMLFPNEMSQEGN